MRGSWSFEGGLALSACVQRGNRRIVIVVGEAITNNTQERRQHATHFAVCAVQLNALFIRYCFRVARERQVVRHLAARREGQLQKSRELPPR